MSGKRQAPQRRAAIEAQHRLEGDRHHQPGGQPSQRADPCRAAPAPAARDRPAPGGDGAHQHQRRIAELGVGRARDHAADRSRNRHRDGCCTARWVRPSQIGPCRLRRRAERAIVDQRRRGSRRCRRPLQRIAADQHAAAGGRRRRIAPVHPGEGIEHLEEEDEGGDQQPLGEGLAAKLGHQRDQVSRRARRAQPGGGALSGHGRYRHRSARNSRRRRPRPGSTPCAIAQSLPVQPGGSAVPPSTSRRRRPSTALATAAVPSLLASSTRMTRNGPDSPGRAGCRSSGRSRPPRRGRGRSPRRQASVTAKQVRRHRARAPARSRRARRADRARSRANQPDADPEVMSGNRRSGTRRSRRRHLPVGAAAIAEFALGLGRGEEHVVSRHPEPVDRQERLLAGQLRDALVGVGERHQGRARQPDPRRRGRPGRRSSRASAAGVTSCPPRI